MVATDSRLALHIQLVVMALILTAAVALGYVLDDQQRKALLVELEDEMDVSLRLNNAHLQQSIGTLRQDVLFLARTPPVSGIARAAFNGGIDPRDHNSQATWLKRLQEIFTAFSLARPGFLQIRYIGVADGGRELVRVERHGERVMTVPASGLQGKGERDYVRETLRLKPGEIYLSEFDLNRENGRSPVTHIPTLRAATPVFGADGKVFGLVVINMAANTVLKPTNSRLPAQARFYVANQHGDYLVHPDARLTYGFETGRDARMTQDYSALAGAFNPVRHLRLPLRPIETPAGRQYAMTECVHFDPRRPERFLVAATLLPDSVIAAELKSRRQEVLFGSLLAMLLLGVLVVFLLNWLLAPLRKVTLAARAIADGDREVSLPEKTHGEVGTLVVAFRAMLAEILHREEDWQRLNAKLESEVVARTAELRVNASVYENTSEGAMIVSEDGIIVSVNPAFTEITGYRSAEAVGQPCGLLKSHRHDAAFYADMWRQLRENNRWQGEIWNRRKSGEAYLEWLTINFILPMHGMQGGYVAVFRDITEQRQADEHIRHLAFHDALTGLPNRALFQERLSHAVARAGRDGGRLSVAFIDLDGFKAVNDRFGHAVGDLLLQEMAKRIATRLRRDMDTVARLGGDEFVVLMEDLQEPAHCASLASEIIAALTQPAILNGEPLQVGASMGIAIFPEDGDSVIELMKRADSAMYVAKAAGKGTYRFARDGM